MAIFIGVCAGLFTAYWLYHWLFGDFEEFASCVRFWLTPEWISMLFGEWRRDIWSELKLFIWLGVSMLVGYGAYLEVLS